MKKLKPLGMDNYEKSGNSYIINLGLSKKQIAKVYKRIDEVMGFVSKKMSEYGFEPSIRKNGSEMIFCYVMKDHPSAGELVVAHNNNGLEEIEARVHDEYETERFLNAGLEIMNYVVRMINDS